mmetsp:Transcript_38547/g.64102  ORF Transcript_38547/g.64102 Transcript_38547/m.64102 type:complete len:101 (-) Transcript_38547:1545-1847(-)
MQHMHTEDDTQTANKKEELQHVKKKAANWHLPTPPFHCASTQSFLNPLIIPDPSHPGQPVKPNPMHPYDGFYIVHRKEALVNQFANHHCSWLQSVVWSLA